MADGKTASQESSATAKPQLAVVTGASSGIGFELAQVFAENNYDLIVCAQSDGIGLVVPNLEKHGARVDVVQADLATGFGVEAVYQKIKESGRAVDALVLNAGVGLGGDFVRENDLATILNLIDLNVRSTVHLTKLVAADMVQNGSGRILFTSSIAAMMPGAFEAVYGASKAFVQSFAQAIREELKDTGVTVTSLQPGPTETNFFHRANMDDTRIGSSKKDDAATVARQGFEAMMAGKDHVVAGSLMNKLMAAAGKFLPESVGAAAHRHMSEPGTGSH